MVSTVIAFIVFFYLWMTSEETFNPKATAWREWVSKSCYTTWMQGAKQAYLHSDTMTLIIMSRDLHMALKLSDAQKELVRKKIEKYTSSLLGDIKEEF